MGDAILEALWKRVTDDWDDDRTHGAFLHHCRETGQLGEAAARYRGMKGDRDRGASAEARLSAVALLALSSLEDTRDEQPGSPLRLVVAAGMGLLVLLATYSVVRALR